MTFEKNGFAVNAGLNSIINKTSKRIVAIFVVYLGALRLS